MADTPADPVPDTISPPPPPSPVPSPTSPLPDVDVGVGVSAGAVVGVDVGARVGDDSCCLQTEAKGPYIALNLSRIACASTLSYEVEAHDCDDDLTEHK